MTDHTEVRTHVFELLRDVFAQRLELPTAIGAVIIGGQMDALFAFKMSG
ncbi:hypothetical protein BURCENBC7_AP6121 [Burkholderia cenocepacia BC7]|nr:hypothetical protein BURCENBC7_AP6121 [Burkholderia cenocepacia BC7]